MMMKKAFLRVLLFAAFLLGVPTLLSAGALDEGPAPAVFTEDLISVVAEPSLIEINLLYDKQNILIFGSMIKPANLVLRVASREVPLMVHRRKNKYGFWVTDYGWEIDDTSAFYGVYSSGNLNQLLSEQIRQDYDFVLVRGRALPTRFTHQDDKYEFYQGLLRQRQRQNLWQQDEGGIVIDDHLFRMHLSIPPQAPEGDYTVEAFLIDDRGGLLSKGSFVFEVRRGGWNRALYLLAQDNALLYGIAGVVFCFLLGLFVSLVFHRY